MADDYSDEILQMARNACDWLQAEGGFGKEISGTVHERALTMWAWLSADFTYANRAATLAIAEFAYARALDAMQGTHEALPSAADVAPVDCAKVDFSLAMDTESLLAELLPVLRSVSGIGAKVAALAYRMNAAAESVRGPKLAGILDVSAKSWDEAVQLVASIQATEQTLQSIGAFYPRVRASLTPAPLLGLSDRARRRALNDDLIRMAELGVGESALAKILYGHDASDDDAKLKRMRTRLDDAKKSRNRENTKNGHARTAPEGVKELAAEK